MLNTGKLNKLLIWVKKILIDILIIVIKIVLFLASFMARVFFIIKKPFVSVLRILFYKVVVKGYCLYRSFLTKIGMSKRKENLVVFLLNEKTVHVLVAVLTFLVIMINITHNTYAVSDFSQNKKPIIVSLIRGEFGNLNQEEELITETAEENSVLKIQENNNKSNDLAVVSADQNELYKDSYLKKISILNKNTTQSKKDIKNIKKRDKIVKYTVGGGDTISSIAANFGISVNTILWENNLSIYSLIRPGDELTILPMTGVMHSVKSGESLRYIANKYNVDEKDIITANNITNPNNLKINQKLIIPNGSKIKTYVKNTKVYSSAITAVVKNIVNKSNIQSTGNKMHWPTTGHRITQYYHLGHTGLDIADPVGTPLFAADAGVVEKAGWSRGYGNNIVINHGGGKKTRYAHMHKFYVSRGQSVSRGQTIGEMGSTGWSTGPHVHFEVIINGIRYNPLNYIK